MIMKKVWLVLLATVLVFGLVVSCGGSSSDDEEAGEDGVIWSHDLGAFSLEITKNEYGKKADGSPASGPTDSVKGFQKKLSDEKLFDGSQVKKGDKYTLEFEVYLTVRNVGEDIQFGLVDATPEADYWTPLAHEGDDVKKIDMAEINAATEAAPLAVSVEFVAIADATAATKAANDLFFQTGDELHTDGPFTMNFTSFVLKKIK